LSTAFNLPPRESAESTALRLLERGYWPTVTRPGEKRPIDAGWGENRKTTAEVEDLFRSYPTAGVGVCLGPGRAPGGGWLIDLEGDGPQADDSLVKLFDGEVVETLGWNSVRGSHSLFVVAEDFLDGMMAAGAVEGKGHGKSGVWKLDEFPDLEFRIGGFKPDGAVKQVHSACPPTPGTDGNPRVWNGVRTLAKLPTAAIENLRRIARSKPAHVEPKPPVVIPMRQADDRRGDPIKRASAWLDGTPGAVSGQGGHDHTYYVACTLVHAFGLGVNGTRPLLQSWNRTCQPPWSEAELEHKLQDAAKASHDRPCGWKLDEDRPGWNPPARSSAACEVKDSAEQPEPDDFEVVGVKTVESRGKTKAVEAKRALDDPVRLAGIFLQQYEHPDRLTLAFHRETFYRWDDGRWQDVDSTTVSGQVLNAIDDEFMRLNSRPNVTKPKKVSTGLNSNVLSATKANRRVALDFKMDAPAWLCDGMAPASEYLATKNAVVHLPSVAEDRPGAVIPPTPNFFAHHRLDFDYDPDAPEPVEWLKFLNVLWGDDSDSKALLQEWFGYALTPDTSRQKIMTIIGPPRSGKGTIANVLTALLGSQNVAPTSMSSIATNFGKETLIGKLLAVFGDARITGAPDEKEAVDVLKTISGEDRVMVDRKYEKPWVGKLPVRFVILSNDYIRFKDESGAGVGRLLVLKTTESFENREDHTLLPRLLGELPSILQWAIDGWMRLREQGRFTIPAAMKEAVEDMKIASCPVKAFADECCNLGPDEEVVPSQLFDAWMAWCDRNNRKDAGNKQTFGSRLNGAIPGIKSVMSRRAAAHPGGTPVRVYRGISLRETF
jgi:putative DNA primase/helicase